MPEDVSEVHNVSFGKAIEVPLRCVKKNGWCTF
jgi:hypothetical protein